MPDTNPYAPPDVPVLATVEPIPSDRGRRQWFYTHVILWVMIAGLLYGVVPKMMVIAADFGIPLTRAAVAVTSASRWATGNGVLSILLFVAIVWADYALMARSPDAARPWRLGFWLTVPPLAIWLLSVWAVYSTLNSFHWRLGG